MALIETLATDEDALSLLSEAMNFDFASKGIDEPFTEAELDNISSTQSMRGRVLRASGLKNPTPRDFVKVSHRARPNQPFVGGRGVYETRITQFLNREAGRARRWMDG